MFRVLFGICILFLSSCNLQGKQAEAQTKGANNTNITSPLSLEGDLEALKAILPFQGVIINPVSPDAAAAFGKTEKAESVPDLDVPGGQAFEVLNETIGLNSWSAGVNWPLNKGIKKDDVVLLAFWAKGIEARNEFNTPMLSSVRVQESMAPYNAAAVGSAFLTQEWKRYFITGKSEHDIAAGPAGFTFHMGLSKQTIRFSPAYVINFGPNVSPAALPRNKLAYDGMEKDAPWRNEALTRIEMHRKGDLIIRVKTQNGLPLSGQEVSVKQVESAFNFGTFSGHNFNEETFAQKPRYYESFKDNFNMATLPLYWQDWGWTDTGNKEKYKKNIEFAVSEGIAWRGHPILWPGEKYIPSRILENKGDPKTQRRQVLDHVNEVMHFIKDYNPVVVDMVNEVRVNQYFKENGNPDLIEEAFHLAHSIAPDIPLMVNDYAILNSGGQNQGAIDFYHDWLKDRLGRGLPLGGIGFQSHMSESLTPPKRVMEILSGFAQYGLPLQITEFDIVTLDEEVQAQYTRDFMFAAFSEPALDSFIIWGWWEGDHWKPEGAMLRHDWSPKPNYQAWRDMVFDEFRTNATVITDETGQVSIRGFKGDYAISVGGQTVSVSLDNTQEIDITL